MDNTWSHNFWGSAFIKCIRGTAWHLLSELPVTLDERLYESFHFKVDQFTSLWSGVSHRWALCLSGIYALIGVTMPAHFTLWNRWCIYWGVTSGARENVRSTSTNCTSDLHWGLGGQERRGGQSGQRNKLPCLFCAPRPGWNQCVAGSQKTQAGGEETGPALINYSDPGRGHLCRVEGGHSAGLRNDLTMWRTPAPTLQDVACPLPLQVPTHDDLERNKGRRWHQAWLPKLKEQNGSSHPCWHLGGLAVWQERCTGHKTKQSRLHYGYLWLTDTDLQCMLRKPSIIIGNVLEQEQFCYCALLVCHFKMTLMSVGLPHTTSAGLQNADLEAINIS